MECCGGGRETNWALGMGFWESSHETRVCEGEVKCELVFNAYWVNDEGG